MTPAGKRGLRAAILAASLLAGCVAEPVGSPSPSTLPTSSPPISGQLAPGCEPIDLRGPDGQPVDLTGAWRSPPDIGFFFGSRAETTWMRQIGDCVAAAILDEKFRTNPDVTGSIGTMRGRITSGFVLEGELVAVRFDPGYLSEPADLAPIRFLIEWDANGRILLREDRDPRVGGPRCYSTPLGRNCPPPVILYRVEDLPALTPSPT